MRAIGLGLVATVVAVACSHGMGEPGTTVTTSSPVTPSSAPYGVQPNMNLAGEICNRELACNRIGAGARYNDVGTCVQTVGQRIGREMSAWECSPGAARAREKDCLASIREEPCISIVDREMRIPVCPVTVDCRD